MLFYPTEKMALFIDGPNVYAASKALGFDLDYAKLHETFAKKGILVRAFYYTAMADTAEFTPLKPLVDWLEYHGWKLVTKPMKVMTDSQGRERRRGNMDIELAIDAMEISASVDHLVIMSGDGDFCRLVDSLQRRGKRVTVVSTIRSNPPLCADELRRIADNFVDMKDLELQIGRPMAQREVPHA